MEKGENLNLVALIPSQHFTKPPVRFSDSSLVKALEEEGIGRPSTYAPIIQTLILRNYIRRIKGYFHPSELGYKVCELLIEYFPTIMDVTFTASMEEKLDEIEEAQQDKVKLLRDFYTPFKESLDYAQGNIKKEVVVTSEICPQCGKPMVVKWGRKGKFLSCSAYPECKSSKSITTGVRAPANCGGELIERRSAEGSSTGVHISLRAVYFPYLARGKRARGGRLKGRARMKSVVPLFRLTILFHSLLAGVHYYKFLFPLVNTL